LREHPSRAALSIYRWTLHRRQVALPPVIWAGPKGFLDLAGQKSETAVAWCDPRAENIWEKNMVTRIEKKFLTEDYSKKSVNRDWTNRKKAPNAFDTPVNMQTEKSLFRPSVEGSLKYQYDEILKPAVLVDEKFDRGIEIRDLPEGYSIVVELYRDHEFMNEIRFQNKSTVDKYLVDHHPLVVKYLSAHSMRVIAQVIGLNDSDSKKILLADEVSVCTISTVAAIAAAVAEAEAVAVAAAGACVVASTKGTGFVA